jgi:hypothetical protein
VCNFGENRIDCSDSILIKRELKKIHIHGCRCNERLKSKTWGSKHLSYTGLSGGRGYLKIMTMFKDERFESVMGECEI